MNKIEVAGFGKINLTLDILGKREDGYHEVEMVMQAIALSDQVTMEKADSISVSSNRQEVPTDSSNLVHKVAVALKEYTSYKGGAHIHIEKNIPIAAGLAGGSTDAAATLVGLNKLWDLKLTQEQLMEIGGGLGSDIPFCLIGGTALAQGRGEILTPLVDIPTIDLVLVKPPIGVSTKEVYTGFKAEKVTKKPNTSLMLKAIKEGNVADIAANIANVLETVTIEMHPIISEIKDLMLKAGARAVLMSGSGPTVFAIADNGYKAEEIAEVFKVKDFEVIVTRTIGR